VPLMVGFCKSWVEHFVHRRDDANDFGSWLAVPYEGNDQF